MAPRSPAGGSPSSAPEGRQRSALGLRGRRPGFAQLHRQRSAWGSAGTLGQGAPRQLRKRNPRSARVVVAWGRFQRAGRRMRSAGKRRVSPAILTKWGRSPAGMAVCSVNVARYVAGSHRSALLAVDFDRVARFVRIQRRLDFAQRCLREQVINLVLVSAVVHIGRVAFDVGNVVLLIVEILQKSANRQACSFCAAS